MGIFGGFEWIIIVFVIFLLFGAKRIPQLMKGIGEGIRELRNARVDEDEEFSIRKQK